MNNRLEALTAARFFAALAVVLYHTGYLPFGHLSVSFFFVLSGFVLSLQNRDSVRTFYFKRFARIYPLYAVGLLLAVPGLVFHFKESGIAAVALTPMLLQAWYAPAALTWNSPGWSLSCEAFFYAVMPVIRNRFWLVALITAMLPLPWLMGGNIYFPLWSLPLFCLGIVTHRVYTTYKFRVPWILSTLAVLPLCFTSYAESNLRFIVFGPLFAILILGLTTVAKTPKSLITLGEASYALYILHYPVVFAFKVATHAQKLSPIAALLATVISVAVSLYAALVIDPYLHSLLSRRFAPRPVAAAATA